MRRGRRSPASRRQADRQHRNAPAAAAEAAAVDARQVVHAVPLLLRVVARRRRQLRARSLKRRTHKRVTALSASLVAPAAHNNSCFSQGGVNRGPCAYIELSR